MARALVKVPEKLRRGEIFTVKSLIYHVMETGFRHAPGGTPIPRDIITRLQATYNGAPVFEADFFPAMSANPYLAFEVVATRTGTLTVTWSGDNGFRQSETVEIVVE